MSKYDALTKYLVESGQSSLSMTFDQVANVAGVELPPSAFKYRAWWSNNETNSVITRAWRKAGYETRNVDMEKRKLEFFVSPRIGVHSDTYNEKLSQDAVDEYVIPKSSLLDRVSGILEGTVTIYVNTDLTKPLDEEWSALE